MTIALFRLTGPLVNLDNCILQRTTYVIDLAESLTKLFSDIDDCTSAERQKIDLVFSSIEKIEKDVGMLWVLTPLDY
jgi:hypothetical protein